MPMRWRWPPENSCGIAAGVVRRQADQRQQLGDALAPRSAARKAVRVERLADDGGDAHARIEAGERILEDDLQFCR